MVNKKMDLVHDVIASICCNVIEASIVRKKRYHKTFLWKRAGDARSTNDITIKFSIKNT